MKNILIFAGTTEGRKIAEYLQDKPAKVYVSTATAYGKECVKISDNETIIAGRMDETAMIAFIQEKMIQIVIDATHPFAQDVTRNIQSACKVCQVEYMRCLRDACESYMDDKNADEEPMIIVHSIDEAVAFCRKHDGNIFITTGSKELAKYTAIEDYRERCYARVLSTEPAVAESIQLGFQGKHLIAMQGPFSKEMNIATMHSVDAKIMVTKESGNYGGFVEKVEAAREVHALLIVIARPEEAGQSLTSVLERLKIE